MAAAGRRHHGEVAVDVALVAGEAHRTALRARVRPKNGGPRRLALLAVHDFVAIRKSLARSCEEHLLTHLVAAWQQRLSTTP